MRMPEVDVVVGNDVKLDESIWGEIKKSERSGFLGDPVRKLKKRRQIFFPTSQKDLEPIWKFKMDATTLVLFVLFLKAEVFQNPFPWTLF